MPMYSVARQAQFHTQQQAQTVKFTASHCCNTRGRRQL